MGESQMSKRRRADEIPPVRTNVSLEWLQEWAARQPPNRYPYGYMLALGTLNAFCGKEWLEKRVIGETAAGYLSPVHGDFYRHNHHIRRVIELGENLFNVQRVEGVLMPESAVLPGLYRNYRLIYDKKGTESLCMELEAMKLLTLAGLEFSIVPESTVRGERTSDLQVFVPGHGQEYCEAKCYEDGAVVTDEKLKIRVEGVSKQLKPGGSGIALLKVPQEWADDSDFIQRLQRVVARVFGTTSRIGLLVVYTSAYSLAFGETVAPRTIQIVEFANRDAPAHEFLKGGLFGGRVEYPSPNWLDFLLVQAQ